MKIKDKPLNAVGRPYSAKYDPKYRMRHRVTNSLRVRQGRIGGIYPDKWLVMCRLGEMAAVKARRMTLKECRFYKRGGVQ